MTKEETDFKRWLRRAWWPRWSEAIEPGLGSGVGIPDLLLMSWVKTFSGEEAAVMFPVELKIARLGDGNQLFPEEVRAAQIRWSFEFWKAGGRSFFLFGVPVRSKVRQSGWMMYVMRGDEEALRGNLDQGLVVGKEVHPVHQTEGITSAMIDLDWFFRNG